MREASLSHAATTWGRKASQFVPAVSGYALALLAVALAWLVRQSLDHVLGDAQAFPSFYVAIALVAWLAGWRPAVLALILGYLTADWFFLPPKYSLGVQDWKHVVELVTYFFVGGTSILCIASLRKAEKQARDNAQALQQEKMELETHIQKRKQAEEVLARSRQELERLVKERTARLQETVGDLEHFSYSITHDMRAPLRAIQSYATLLEEESAGRLPAQSLEFLRRIRAASHRMDRLIEDSLDYTKILRKEMPLQPVDIFPLLRDIIETYPNLQSARANIRLEFDRLLLLGNESAFTQIFSNLLGNAVKFVAPGVTPCVRVWAEERGISVSASNATLDSQERARAPLRSVVRVWIEDNGIGIPDQARAKIFGMFQRMHREDQYPGTGIGLAVVSKALERMGGQVGFESELGKGSRFWLEVPGSNEQVEP